MRHAAELAERGRGTTAPNPCVGAVLVQDGRVAAEGWHQRYGGPHAEVECLADAARRGVDPADCALFVTLEPCNHQGKTPPCSRAVLKAGVREVYIGAMDPTEQASGGAAFLAANGVAVHAGVEEALCRDLIADFTVWRTTDRPYVYLKLAGTLDGRIATREGHSKWITCAESRAAVHTLRALCGAVIVGGNTLRADDPRLNVRRAEVRGRDPLAVVVTSRLPEAGEDYFLLRERPAETIFWTTADAADSDRARALARRGVRVWALPPDGADGLDLAAGLARLRGECRAWYALCEGGGRLALRLTAGGLMDEFRFYVAPKILGDAEATPLFAGRAPRTMDQALGLRLADVRASGEDALLVLRPRREGEDDVHGSD